MQSLQSGTKSADLFPQTYIPRTAGGSFQNGAPASTMEQSGNLQLLQASPNTRLEVVGPPATPSSVLGKVDAPQQPYALGIILSVCLVGMVLLSWWLFKKPQSTTQ